MLTKQRIQDKSYMDSKNENQKRREEIELLIVCCKETSHCLKPKPALARKRLSIVEHTTGNTRIPITVYIYILYMCVSVCIHTIVAYTR